MPTFTTNYNFNKPLVNNATDADLWGGQLNTNFDSLDSIIFNGTGYNGGTAAGTANAITATPTPALTAYSNLDGKVMALKIANTNTSGTVTMQLSGLSTPPSVKKFIGGSKVDLAVGDLQAGMMGLFSRDGTDIILLNPRGYSQGADIASAGTVNLETATGDYVVVTGTTTITALTLSQGREVTVRFSGILTLTNGASLILPSGANITTAAGDIAVFRGEASGVVRCVSYTRASGAALVGSGGIKTVQTASASATIDFTVDPANYTYTYFIEEIVPTTDGTFFEMLTSVDGFGATLAVNTIDQGGTLSTVGRLTNSAMNFGETAAIDKLNGTVLFNQCVSGVAGAGSSSLTARNNADTGYIAAQCVISTARPATFINRVRFRMDTGTIASGSIIQIATPIT